MRMKFYSKILTILFLLIVSCSDEGVIANNPLDPEGDNFVEPDTSITTENLDGSIINTSYVNIGCSGNELVSEYSYNLDNLGWSDWFSDSNLTLSYLDEGMHNFKIKGRYPSGQEDESPAEINFEVDAVDGPGLRLYPLKKEADIGSSFDVYIYAEEVQSVVFAEIQLSYDSDHLTFMSSEVGDIVSGSNDNSILIVDDSSGIIDISLASDFIDESGVDGTGAFVKLTFTLNSAGESYLSISEGSSFLSFDNQNISVVDIANGVVVSK